MRPKFSNICFEVMRPAGLIVVYQVRLIVRRVKPWNWRPTIAATPRSRMPFATSSTAWG